MCLPGDPDLSFLLSEQEGVVLDFGGPAHPNYSMAVFLR